MPENKPQKQSRGKKMTGKSAGNVVLYVILGGLLGGLLSELLSTMVASTGLLHDVLVRGFAVGFTDPLTLNLKIIVVKFGIEFYLTLLSLSGMILGLYLGLK
jgi:hypothetical protein